VNDLSRQADALLEQQPQDEEFPFYTEDAERRRSQGRGREGTRFRETALTEMLRAIHATPDEQVERVDTAQRLLRAARLTMEERASFLLSVQFGMTDQEIGEFLGRHRETVLIARQSARRKLRQAADLAGLAA